MNEIIYTISEAGLKHLRLFAILSILLVGAGLCPCSAWSETYGVRDSEENFIPKVNVTVKPKEILIKKNDPKEQFKSIALRVNSKNSNLLRNVGLLKIQWIGAQNQAGPPALFVGPRYDPATKTFQESMLKSAALKIIDSSTRDLFAGKQFPDLFTLIINDQACVSSESFYEKDRPVKMGAGRDLSVDVDKTSITFNEGNLKKGEIVNVDNRSGQNQSISITGPEEILLYFQVMRKPEQTKVPKETWERVALEADSGVFIVLIPDPSRIAELNGKEIVIKVWEGAKVRETRRVPIRTSGEPVASGRSPRAEDDAGGEEPDRSGTDPRPTAAGKPQQGGPAGAAAGQGGQTAQTARPRAESGARSASIWLWAALGLNLVILAAVGAYGLFYLGPKIQVLEDRVAKNEMFLHGSREAIREELIEAKEEILHQCRKIISEE
jgi:hypothetical protein